MPQRGKNSKHPVADHPKPDRKSGGQSRSKHLWSADVTAQSDALDLENHVFARKPAEIAQSLKRSAERSHRRKTTPFQSAMSMLNFYINRAGKNLTAKRRQTLDRAKDELRKAFGRTK
ncbi:DUF3175 domain-containing protein [Hyphomicrobium sp. ghe19]|uniref:DUF3175 domain-containing protein n=1 Tax=Hyphomicrobium sp. ghe19 TaxID=2682968 RepID=UPI0013674873|nr:hypothetical protein HYPP_00570 [Hyphomicrobium sp. ghe19]